jgi:hypothetical protein
MLESSHNTLIRDRAHFVLEVDWSVEVGYFCIIRFADDFTLASMEKGSHF